MKCAYPLDRCAPTRGLPTSYAAPPLKHLISLSDDLPSVWPHPEGNRRGIKFSPLHKSAPKAAAIDSSRYELLTLVDAIETGVPEKGNWPSGRFKAECIRNDLTRAAQCPLILVVTHPYKYWKSQGPAGSHFLKANLYQAWHILQELDSLLVSVSTTDMDPLTAEFYDESTEHPTEFSAARLEPDHFTISGVKWLELAPGC